MNKPVAHVTLEGWMLFKSLRRCPQRSPVSTETYFAKQSTIRHYSKTGEAQQDVFEGDVESGKEQEELILQADASK